MNTVNATPYDETPYVSQPFPQTHPDRLGALGRLFGMAPAASDRCRVLELGCASGGNLIPMAAQAPGASFLGIDLSARQIGDGKAMVDALGFANIELRHQSILDVDASFGKFDYIIAHGVYSWVPAEVQAKILAICRQNLAPQGIAYVSYNTNPGWRMRGMIRDMMLYHSNRFRDASQQVPQARALLDFLAQNVPTENNPYGILLKQELESLRTQGDWYLAHDHLEQVNDPVYFHEFAERAAAQDLQYLGESDFHTMLASNFAPRVAETLRMLAPDIVAMEQYMDFVRNRVFRQTLLVNREVQLNRNLTSRNMREFHVASAARPVSDKPDLNSAAVEQFRGPSGATLATPNPIVKAALTILAEHWPESMSFSNLALAARSRLETGPTATPDATTMERDREVLGTDLLQCFAAAIVEVRNAPVRFARSVSMLPRASALARLQATKGLRVTTLRHEMVNLDELNRQTLLLLDGQHDRAAIVEALTTVVGNGVLTIQQEGRAVTDPATVRAALSAAVDESVKKLAHAALLEA